MSTASLEAGPPGVRFGMRPSRGLLLGLSAARLAAVGASAVLIVVGLVAAGGLGLLATGVVWLPLAASAFVTYRGRPVIEWTPIVSHWALRRLCGQTRYRARLLHPRPAGTMALPGDAAAGNVKQKWPHCDGLKWPHLLARESCSGHCLML